MGIFIRKNKMVWRLISCLAICMTSFDMGCQPVSAEAANKPVLTVEYEEVSLKDAKIKKDKNGDMVYSAVVKNSSKTGTVKKIQYYYKIQVLKEVTKQVTVPVTEAPAVTGSAVSGPAVTEQQTVTEWVPTSKTVVLTAKKIKPGKTSARVSCAGDYTGKISAMKLLKVKLYAGEALYTYHAQTEKGTTSWAAEDTKAPVFSGWIGKNSIYSGVAVRVCYADRKSTYSFKDHVKAVDDRDGKVSFKVDASKINWEKEGIYKVYYTAKDKAGNEAKAWAKVQVYKVGTAESIADEVLRSVIKTSWSDEKKLRAIYRYVKGCCSYTDTGSHTDWRKRAVEGISYQRGDCFTFYSITRLLVTRAGIPNLEVTRYPKRAGNQHWWSLVYVRGGWYHLDTTPRRRDGKFCLVTYEQLLGYSSGSTFRHRQDILPKEATKKISPNP